MEAFVYCWTDFGTNKLYIGVHKGTPHDGYICSSKLMLEEYTKRPNDFSREIVAQGTFSDCYALETAILKSAKADKDPEFYNRSTNHFPFYTVGPKDEEWRKRHSEKMKLLMGTEIQRKIVSKRMLGKRWRLGYKDPIATVEKKRQMRLGKLWSTETKRKIGEGNSKHWRITTPYGEKIDLMNLSKFCHIHNLNIGHMSSRGKTKGYLCERLVP